MRTPNVRKLLRGKYIQLMCIQQERREAKNNLRTTYPFESKEKEPMKSKKHRDVSVCKSKNK